MPGGSAATFARTAAAEGAEVTFIGAVGSDLVGDLLERSLSDCGVRAVLHRVPLPSGVVVIQCRDGDHTIVCSRGANAGLIEAAVDPTLFAGAVHLHVSGYALLSDAQRAAAIRAITLAREHDCSISIDPPPADLIERAGAEHLVRDLARADWLFPNRMEASRLTGQTDPERIVSHLAAQYAGGALKMGAQGAVAWGRGVVDRYQLPPIVGVETVGAGDVFAGAFVVTLLAGGDVGLANRRGCATARRYLTDRAAGRQTGRTTVA